MDWPSFFVGLVAGGVIAVLFGAIIIVIDPDWF